VTLAGHQAWVREQLHYQFGSVIPSPLLLHVPPEVQQRVKIVEGGQRDPEDSKKADEWAVNVPATAGKEHTLTLEYSFPFGEQATEATGTRAMSGQNPSSRSKTSARR